LKSRHLLDLAISVVITSALVFGSPASTSAAIPVGFQDWAMYRHDRLHNGVSGETFLRASNASTLKLHWSLNTGGISYSSPAVVYNATLNESLVYVGNQAGQLNAYNAAGGALIWSYQVPKTPNLSKEIETSPAVFNNVVYFGDGDYHLYALNATNGALICKSASVGGVIAGSPLVVNPDGAARDVVVYFGDTGPSGTVSDGGHITAMYAVGDGAAKQCTTKWQVGPFSGGSGTYTSQAFGNLANGTPVVVFGTSDPDDAVYELDARTGAQYWRFQTLVGTDSDVGAPPTISSPGVNGFADGVVYATGKNGITYAIDFQTGAQIWSFNIRQKLGVSNPSQSGASRVGNTVYMGYGGGVFALKATTGALIWASSPKSSGVVSSPSISGAASDRVIFVGDITGTVHAISVATGADLFTFATGALIFASAGISTGQFFITSSNGYLYAFGE
jgi:outer membrane protein assembly factor BamB